MCSRIYADELSFVPFGPNNYKSPNDHGQRKLRTATGYGFGR